MSKGTRYTDDFKKQIVALYKSGKHEMEIKQAQCNVHFIFKSLELNKGWK